MSELTGIENIDTLLAEGDLTDIDGTLTRCTFLGDGERYIFDADLGDLWKEFDTESDAHYFGVWTNKEKLRILSYAEGDITFTQYKDAESYDATILAMCKFHKPKPELSTIDADGTLTRYYQDRREFFIAPERYPQDARSAWENNEEKE